jgi:hypothetical protein
MQVSLAQTQTWTIGTTLVLDVYTYDSSDVLTAPEHAIASDDVTVTVAGVVSSSHTTTLTTPSTGQNRVEITNLTANAGDNITVAVTAIVLDGSSNEVTYTATANYTAASPGSGQPLDGDSVSWPVGSTTSQAITCNQDVSGKTLQVIFEPLSSTADVATVSDGSLTKSGAVVTFSVPSAASQSERTLRLVIRDTTTAEVYASLLFFVTYDARGD